MTKRISVMLMFLLLISISVMALKVHDVQYTTDPGDDGTYPSLYKEDVVTLDSVLVVAKGYFGSPTSSSYNVRWFVEDLQGGPWSGLYIFDYSHAGQVEIGDIVSVTGQVTEYYGLTELSYISAVTVISRGNPLPPIPVIPTSTLSSAANAEQWEDCLVQFNNVTVTSSPDQYNEWKVTDGSGPAQIDDNFMPSQPTGVYTGQTWVRIRGIVDFSFDAYGLNPRFPADLLQSYTIGSSQISIPTATSTVGQTLDLPILTSKLLPSFQIRKFSFQLSYDMIGMELENIISENTVLGETGVPDSLSYTAGTTSGSFFFNYHASSDDTHNLTTAQETDTLLVLRFRIKQYGEFPIALTNFTYNDIPVPTVTSGRVNVRISKKMAYMNIFRTNLDGSITSKNAFNPRLNEKISIQYGGKLDVTVGFKAILRIYDTQGRLVATPINKIVSTSTGIDTYNWDGRDKEMNLLPLGMYYCHLEVIDRSTGRSETTVQPIIIGAPMKKEGF